MTNDAPLVMVVDDDVDILDAIRFLLEDEGYQVITVERVPDAAALLPAEDARPDLIVLDLLLSGQDGRTICQHLKSSPESRDIPVLMISAHPGARESVMEAGADAFLAKPFSIDALLDIIADRFQLNPAGA